MPSILIVDDDRRFRKIARALLESQGFEVVGEAEDGAPAVVLTSTREESDFGRQLLDHCGARGFVPKDELSGARIAELCR